MDTTRYNRLIASAAFNVEFFNKNINDVGKNRNVMSISGAPTFIQAANVSALKQNAVGDGVTSVAIPSIVDTTTQFWCEILINPASMSLVYVLRQSNAGGFQLYLWPTGPFLCLMTITAASAAARYTTTPNVIFNNKPIHVVMWIDSVGLTAKCWINGVSNVAGFSNSGVPALSAPAVITHGTSGSGLATLIARCWQGTPDDDDA
jgi:hypothetical protein